MKWLTRLFPAKPQAVMAANDKKTLYSEQAFDRMLHYMTTIPDPELLLQKAGIERYMLRQCLINPEIAQCVNTRRDAVFGTPFRLEPNQTRAAKWLHDTYLPFRRIVTAATVNAVLMGYAVVEATYALVGGRIVIARLDERPMEWFRLTVNGWRYYPNDGTGSIEGIELDPRKFWVIENNPTTSNPYGEALLAPLWFPSIWQREGDALWMQYMETFGQPIVIGKMQDYSTFVAAMKAQRVRSAIGFQGQKDDTITTVGGSASGEFERLRRAFDITIQKVLLGQTATSDVSGGGSYAATAVLETVRQDKRIGDCRLEMLVGQKIIDTLAALNGLQTAQYILADGEGIDQERATRDATLVPVLTASGLKFTKNYYTDRYDFEDEDLEVMDVPDAPTTEQSSAVDKESLTTGDATARAIAHMAAPKATAIQQEIDDLGDALLADAPVNPLDMDAVRDAIFGATDEADLQRRLVLAMKDSGPGGVFTDLLDRASFAARVIGYVSAEEGRS